MMQLILIILFGLGFLVETGWAQSATKSVFPPGLENQPGNSNDGLFNAGHGVMQSLHRNTALATEWQTPVMIHGIAFRVNEGSGSYTAVIPKVEIRFSTFTRPMEQFSNNYYVNRGLDELMVYSHNDVSLFSADGQNINPFDLSFVFDQPFVYDPAKGNLLMYISTTQPSQIASQIDSHALPTANTPVLSGGPFSGGEITSYALISEFSWTAIPEPSSFMLLLMGFTFLLYRYRSSDSNANN